MEILRPPRPKRMFTPAEQVNRLRELVRIRDEVHHDDSVTILAHEVLEPRVIYSRSVGKNYQWLNTLNEFPDAPKQSKTLNMLMKKLHRNT